MRSHTRDDEGVFGPSTLDSMRQAHRIASREAARRKGANEEDRRRVGTLIMQEANKGNRSLEGIVKAVMKALVRGS